MDLATIDATALEDHRSNSDSIGRPTVGVRQPPPCDLGCPNRAHCCSTGDTCRQMDHWLHTERVDPALPREPKAQGKTASETRDLGDPEARREALLEALGQWPPMGQQVTAAYLGRSHTTLRGYREGSREVPAVDVQRAEYLAQEFQAGRDPGPCGRNKGRAAVPSRAGGVKGHKGPHRPEAGT